MTVFLSGSAITKKVRSLLEDQKGDLAVAFWGKGATELLGLGIDLKHVRIVCDLRSGACNPTVLQALLDRGCDLRTKDGLHAKVYWTRKGVVIGSSNASANGLGEEDDELHGELEAAVFTDEQALLDQAEKWFSQQFGSAEPVDSRLIKKAKEDWQLRRAGLPNRRRITLLTTLDGNPDFFRRVRVRVLLCSYANASNAAQAAFDAQKSNLFSPAELKRFEVKGVVPFWEDNTDWDARGGDYILDFALLPSIRATPSGAWRIRLGEPLTAVVQNNSNQKVHRVFIADPVDRVAGLPFPKSEQEQLARRITAWLRAQKNWRQRDWTLEEDEHECVLDEPLATLAKKLSSKL